jgi:hypothetical protein
MKILANMPIDIAPRRSHLELRATFQFCPSNAPNEPRPSVT